MHHAHSLSKNVENPVVCEIRRRLPTCQEWIQVTTVVGGPWRRQGTVRKCFVNSTEVVFAAVPPCSTIEVTCNQVNFLRNQFGTRSKDELLGDAFLSGVNVADMKREHCKVLLPAHW